MRVRIDFDYTPTIKFEPRDIWVGIYWDYKRSVHYSREWNADLLKVYICVLPMFPVCLEFRLRFRAFVFKGYNKLDSKLEPHASS